MSHARRPLGVADLYAMKRVGAVVPAPDGSFAVAAVTSFDVPANKGVDTLWLIAPGREPRALTVPERGSARDPAISPDGRRLAFVRETTAGGKPQLHVLELDGGEAQVLTDLPLGARDPRWLPDGRRVVFLAEVLRDVPTIEGTKKLLAERAEQKVTARVTEDRVYRFWDRWLTGAEIWHLFVIDVQTREARDLIPRSERWFDLMEPVGTFDVSPDGTEVAFSADPEGVRGSEPRSAVFAVAIAGGEPRWLSQAQHAAGADAYRPRYSPDGRWMAWLHRRDKEFYADRLRVTRFDRTTEQTTVLTEAWDRSAATCEWTADSRALLIEADDDARVNLFRLGVDGGTPERVAQGGAIRSARAARDGSIWMKRDTLTTPAEVMRLDPSGKLEKLSAFNDALLAELDLGTVEEIRIPGAGGETVQAWIVKPPGYDASRRYPLVHMIHGGPHHLFADELHLRWCAPAFAAPGYVCALVNFHGSTSFGEAWTKSIDGAWGDKPMADVIAVTDHLLATGVADPAKMAITGGSYGGYLTAWIATQTDRFACAIVHAGVFDLSAAWGSDINHRLRRAFGSVPWEDRAAIDRWSPSAHTAGWVTPTLVIHGERDYRVQFTQALELYGILKSKGVPARLVCYPDENHWIAKPHNAMHWYGEVSLWLARWLSPSA